MSTNEELAALELEVRLLRVEARLACPEYQGMWTAARAYTRNAIVSHGGAQWVATSDVPIQTAPGLSADHWQRRAAGVGADHSQRRAPSTAIWKLT